MKGSESSATLTEHVYILRREVMLLRIIIFTTAHVISVRHQTFSVRQYKRIDHWAYVQVCTVRYVCLRRVLMWLILSSVYTMCVLYFLIVRHNGMGVDKTKYTDGFTTVRMADACLVACILLCLLYTVVYLTVAWVWRRRSTQMGLLLCARMASLALAARAVSHGLGSG